MRALPYIAGALIVLTIMFCSYRLYRWISWTVAYEPRVQDTVREMVDPKYLKDDYK